MVFIVSVAIIAHLMLVFKPEFGRMEKNVTFCQITSKSKIPL